MHRKFRYPKISYLFEKKCTKHFFILVSGTTGCISVSAFNYLLVIPIGITSFEIEIKICQQLQEWKGISQ